MYITYERDVVDGDVCYPRVQELGKFISFEWDNFYRCPYFTIQVGGGEIYTYLCMGVKPYQELMASLKYAIKQNANCVMLRGQVEFLREIDQEQNGAPYSDDDLAVKVYKQSYVDRRNEGLYDTGRYALDF